MGAILKKAYELHPSIGLVAAETNTRWKPAQH